MTQPAKKTARKKSATKRTKTRAPKDGTSKETGMDDDEMRQAVLAAALPHAAFDGFSEKLLEEAGRKVGIGKSELARLFEDGPISLVEFYSIAADGEMQKRLAEMDLNTMKIRQRIAAAIKTRLAVLKPNKEAARRAAALLSLPMHAALGAKLVYRTVDAMWRSAGDTSTDFNFYTKRGILAGVYGSTTMRWFNDTSPDEKATDEFLAARIENVMQIEKLKSQAKQILANLPSLADWAKPTAK